MATTITRTAKSAMFKSRTKWYFYTPSMMRRIGKWQHDFLARVGAYGRGVFMKKLSRPQPAYSQLRTVRIDMMVSGKYGGHYRFDETLFVPKRGMITVKKSGRPAPKEAAMKALATITYRLRHRGEGKPPKMGPTKKLRNFNDFRLSPKGDGVIIGTVPFPKKVVTKSASIPDLLNAGGSAEISFFKSTVKIMSSYGPRPYVEPSLGPTLAFALRLIKSHPIN